MKARSVVRYLFECAKCHSLLAASEFVKDASKARGLGSYCKPCKRQIRNDRDDAQKVAEAAAARLRMASRDVFRSRENIRRYKLTHPGWAKKQHASERDRLTDGYVRRILCAGSSLSQKQIPQELIEAKRLHLQILRLLKERKKAHENS